MVKKVLTFISRGMNHDINGLLKLTKEKQNHPT